MAQQKRTRYTSTVVPDTDETIDLPTLVALILRSKLVERHKTPRQRDANVRSAIYYHIKIKNLTRDANDRFSKSQALAWANIRWKGCVQAEIDAYPQRRTTQAFGVDARSPTKQGGVRVTSYSDDPLVLQKALADAESKIDALKVQLEQYSEDAHRYRKICEKNRQSALKRWAAYRKAKQLCI